ncbi:hypothetical protein EBR96_00235 [bacterium]|nr:hypothetical protein [bacterium]
MKKVILSALLGLGLATSVSAYDAKTLVSLPGTSQTTGGAEVRTYHNVGLGNTQLVLGLGASVPLNNETSRALGLAGQVGLTFATDLPVLNDFEVVASFENTSGGLGVLHIAKSVKINKNFVYRLNDKLQLGATVTLADIRVDDRTLNIFSSVTPVVGFTVSL